MILKIDTTSSIPVYAQMVDQIRRAVASGTLRPGDPLPSLRETAVKLRINPLTVNKAYKLLEYEGLIETRQGRGSFVAAGVEAASEEYRRETLTRAIDDLVVDAHHMGVSNDELRELFEERVESAENDLQGETPGRIDT